MRVVATAGHVDHGKSSLVQALTGTNPDRFEEERRRGLTIDLGFAHTLLGNGEGVSFIDVPGHVRFLRNMLAGVGGVDACMFVVAATEGWKPQSEEHLRILELVGLQHGFVALTKADLVDDEWRELQEMDVRDHLAGTFLAEAPIVAVSATTGEGIDAVRAALATLVATTPAAIDRGRPRLWIDRVFAAKGSGTVITGTLTGGTVRTDDQLHAGGHPVRVRSVQSHGDRHDSIGPGNRVALNLVGVDHTDLHRGDAVVTPAQWRPTRRFDAGLTVLASLAHVVSRRGAYAAYIGSGEFPVKLRVLGSESIRPGGAGLVRLHLATELPLMPGDRFVLRESGRDETVGGGEVLDVAPVRPASKAQPNRDVDRVIDERGWVTLDDLEALTGERRTATVAHWVVSPSALAATQHALRQRVAAASELGLDIALLDDRERAAIATLDGVAVEAGRARPVAAKDPLADHPFVAALLAGGTAPPDPAGVDKAQLRELVRRTLVVERDGLYFHPRAIETAAHAAAGLLRTNPTGFTMSQFREALGNTRKHAVPLATEMDARGITRRRDDVRIAGPKLPAS
ncbi:MAG TPA: selenocysteine-specific translation elongation factor [Ilumatobacteraceae bacterium]|jgi:selenocysteine-specific elongation factor|nr:selenocysteine-specific translation elongation factor [Ilumatobacteraceae bacterium]MBP7890040.1 selenocysteine-specific translation elongation factor [Ilumatobacteraceae bacterium]HQY15305.1 selenocysteine-specific translation elongation factor [Ilumatobacteraceae bacterium]